MSDPTQDIATWLFEYFEEASGALLDRSGDVHYFDAGLIDSVDVIWLIEAAEAEFGVEFSDADFRDPRFATVHGLAQIIAGLQGDA